MNNATRYSMGIWVGLAAASISATALAAGSFHVTPTSSSVEHRAQSWSVMVLQGKITGNLRGYLEVQPRVDLQEPSLDRVLIRPALVYALGKEITLWAGYAAIGALGTADPRGVETIWEHRLWQQVQHEKEFGGVIVVNRTRFEQRFLPDTDDVGLRIRHMLRAVIPVNDKRTWAVVFSDEIFFNLNSANDTAVAGFDQNRAFAGVSWNATPKLRLEWGYMNNFVNRPAADQDRMNHIALFLMSYTF